MIPEIKKVLQRNMDQVLLIRPRTTQGAKLLIFPKSTCSIWVESPHQLGFSEDAKLEPV